VYNQRSSRDRKHSISPRRGRGDRQQSTERRRSNSPARRDRADSQDRGYRRDRRDSRDDGAYSRGTRHSRGRSRSTTQQEPGTCPLPWQQGCGTVKLSQQERQPQEGCAHQQRQVLSPHQQQAQQEQEPQQEP
jgi:hypothetical protein